MYFNKLNTPLAPFCSNNCSIASCKKFSISSDSERGKVLVFRSEMQRRKFTQLTSLAPVLRKVTFSCIFLQLIPNFKCFHVFLSWSKCPITFIECFLWQLLCLCKTRWIGFFLPDLSQNLNGMDKFQMLRKVSIVIILLTSLNGFHATFSVTEATLQPPMSVSLSVCLSVCHQNPSTSQNRSYRHQSTLVISQL